MLCDVTAVSSRTSVWMAVEWSSVVLDGRIFFTRALE